MSPCIKKRSLNCSKIDKINILLKYAVNTIEDECSDMDENIQISMPIMKKNKFIQDVPLFRKKSNKLIKKMSKILKEEDKLINDQVFFVDRE